MTSAAPTFPKPPPLVDSLTDEQIAAEYAACRDPDGTLNWERFRAMSLRLYGVELVDARPDPVTAEAGARAWREAVACAELLPEDPELLDVAPANTDASRRP